MADLRAPHGDPLHGGAAALPQTFSDGRGQGAVAVHRHCGTHDGGQQRGARRDGYRGFQFRVEIPEVMEQAVVPCPRTVVEEHAVALGLPVHAALGHCDRAARFVHRHQRAGGVGVDPAAAVLESDEHHRGESQFGDAAIGESFESEFGDDPVVEPEALSAAVAIPRPVRSSHVPGRGLQDEPGAVGGHAWVAGERTAVAVRQSGPGPCHVVDFLRPLAGDDGGHFCHRRQYQPMTPTIPAQPQ